MNVILRLTVCLVALGVAGISLDFLQPGGLANLAAELGELPRLKLTMHREVERQQQLQEETLKIVERIAKKRQMAVEVVAGRLSLLEAASRFRQLAEADGKTVKEDGPEESTPHPKEGHFRNVIAYVRLEFAGQTEVVAVMVPQLEKELRQTMDRAEACRPGKDY